MLEHLRAPFKKLIEPLAKALISIGPTCECGDGHRHHWNHCGCLRHRHHGVAFRWSRSTDIAGAGRFPGRFNREADHGRTSQFGAFLDSTLDRIADWALLAGVIVFSHLARRLVV